MEPSLTRARPPGRWLRQVRRAQGVSQDTLARPEFTPAYLHALEQGRVSPSPVALELLAGRLGLPVAELLAVPWPTPAAPDLDALHEDLGYQVDCARRALDHDQAATAVVLLDAAEQYAAPYHDRLDPAVVYRLYYTRGAVRIRLGRPAEARPDLEQAWALATQIPGGGEQVARVRNAIGAAYYVENRPALALAHHTACVRAIQDGVIQDLNLRLLVYSNLANDYWALNDLDQAISGYKEALTLLDEVSNHERQAAIYWGLSLAYRAKQDLAWAVLYADRALRLYEQAPNASATAQMQVNLAELLILRGDYRQAAPLLNQARAFQSAAGDPVLLSVVYEHYAMLALRQDAVAQAAEYTATGLRLVAAAHAAADGVTRAHAARGYARLLRMAGLLAERQGAPARADTHFAQALALAEQAGMGEAAQEIHESYADVLAARGAYAPAARHYREAALRPRRRLPTLDLIPP